MIIYDTLCCVLGIKLVIETDTNLCMQPINLCQYTNEGQVSCSAIVGASSVGTESMHNEQCVLCGAV